MIQTTLGVIVKNGKIFLGEKKRGFAKGVLNGIGGKVDGDESIDKCMIRESKEEIGINVESLEKVGEMNFYFEKKPELNLTVYLYNISKYSGEIIESDEIKPFWFNLDKIPYDKMWDFDKIRLPRFLNGEKNINYNVYYDDEMGKCSRYEEVK